MLDELGIIKNALKYGITLLNNDGTMRKVKGIFTLSYVQQTDDFILVFQEKVNGIPTNSYVLLKDHNLTWMPNME